MSWLGTILGVPVAGNVQLLLDINKVRASAWAFNDKGICIPIWSPSKSALKAEHTSGWSCIDFDSVIFGWKAWMLILCRVGALFNSI